MKEPVNYIALAIPVFFLLIGVELLVSRLRGEKLYRMNDAITNISCGITQQVVGILMKGASLFGYILLLNFFWGDQGFFHSGGIPVAWWSWVILFIGVDFFYYWFHRYSHEISLIWGSHIVHHQSEEYNLSVALRQGAFQVLFSSLFYLPLAVIGFDWVMFVIVNQFQTLYQFWIHTKTINKLPKWFEFIFNTPSHHRVHHGVNPKYIDRNHGGTLIIFDRIFGTFQEEEEEVVYGITKPLKSWNPVWAQLDYYLDLFKAAGKAEKWGDKFRIFFKGPGWMPAELGGVQIPPSVDPKTAIKYDQPSPIGLNYYALFQYVIILLGTTAFLFLSPKMNWFQVFSLAGMILFSVMNLGGLFDWKKWAIPAEIIRLAALLGIPFLLMYEQPMFLPALLIAVILGVVSLIWMSRLYKGVEKNPLPPI